MARSGRDAQPAYGYDIIEHQILWETVRSDLPPLVNHLEKILADREGE